MADSNLYEYVYKSSRDKATKLNNTAFTTVLAFGVTVMIAHQKKQQLIPKFSEDIVPAFVATAVFAVSWAAFFWSARSLGSEPNSIC